MSDDLRNRVAQAKAAYDEHRDIASQQEPDATSEYIAALEAERDENWQKYVDANEARIAADAALAEMDGMRVRELVLQCRISMLTIL